MGVCDIMEFKFNLTRTLHSNLTQTRLKKLTSKLNCIDNRMLIEVPEFSINTRIFDFSAKP